MYNDDVSAPATSTHGAPSAPSAASPRTGGRLNPVQWRHAHREYPARRYREYPARRYRQRRPGSPLRRRRRVHHMKYRPRGAVMSTTPMRARATHAAKNRTTGQAFRETPSFSQFKYFKTKCASSVSRCMNCSTPRRAALPRGRPTASDLPARTALGRARD